VRRHDLDWVYLISGGIFLLVAVTHLVGAAVDGDVDMGWLVPALLVGLGAAGLAGAVRAGRSTLSED
jgi:hypothetical protein